MSKNFRWTQEQYDAYMEKRCLTQNLIGGIKSMRPPTQAEYEVVFSEPEKKPRRNKYGNIPVIIDGIRFQSTFEGNYYRKLVILRRAGELTFKLQVPFKLTVNEILITKYIADFVVQYKDGTAEVIDTKGVKTPEYKIKARLMEAIHGITIKEVYQN